MGISDMGGFFDTFDNEEEQPVIEAYQGDLVFNGVNGETGGYGVEPMPTEKMVRLIQGKPDPEDFANEQQRARFEKLSE